MGLRSSSLAVVTARQSSGLPKLLVLAYLGKHRPSGDYSEEPGPDLTSDQRLQGTRSMSA